MTDPLVGVAVAHYEVLAKLGGGGMGVVYTARDARLGRIVALKFLPPQWSHDESAKQRFLREAQAASATDHRNICTIHGIETAADGQLVIVMAHYAGETLKQKLEGGALPIEEAVEIAAQVAEGLAKAHAEGVVHRDIKPGNLMITGENLKILDFGLAKFANSLQLTLEGSTLGTVAYMSPEQSRGEDADARSDVWAVGVVLFEMITGTLPFRGAYPEAISHAIRNDAVPPVRAGGRDVPSPLARIVERALVKDPAGRTQSARELARDLRQLQGRTVPLDLLTGPVTAPALQLARPRRWWRSPAVLASAAVVALAAGITPLWLFAPVTRVPVVVAPVVNQTGYAELDAYRPALTAELIAELSDLPNVRVLPYDRELQILRRFRAAGQNAGQDISSREAIQALTANSGARVVIVPTLLYENAAWRARVEFRDATTATNAAVQDTPPVVSSLIKDTAYGLMPSLAAAVDAHFVATGPRRAEIAQMLARAAGRAAPPPQLRLRTLDTAAAFEQGLSAYDDQEYAAALGFMTDATVNDGGNALLFAWRSRVAQLLRRDAEATDAAAQAVRLAPQLSSPPARLFVDAIVAEARRDFPTAEARYLDLTKQFADEPGWLVELAAFHDRRTQFPNAVTTYHQALAMDPHLPRARLELCRLYNRLQEPANAKEQAAQALTDYRRLGNRGGEALTLFCEADTLRLGTDMERAHARQDADDALRILRELGYAYNIPRAHYYVGLVAGEENRLDQAAASWQTAASTAQAAGNAVLEPLVLMNLGVTFERLGNPGRASEYYRQSSASYEKLGDDRRAAQTQANGAFLRITYGDKPADAFRDLQNAIGVLRKLGDKDFEVYSLEGVGTYYRYVGQYEEADRELNRALALAKERDLPQKIATITIQLGRSKFDRNDYPAAAALFEQATAKTAGANAIDARIHLARAYLRMGKMPQAQDALMIAARDIDLTHDQGRRPLLDETLGELAYQSGRQSEARTDFARASATWTSELPDESAVLARGYLGWLDAASGQTSRGLAAVTASIQQAHAMDRITLETFCRVLAARIYLLEARKQDAIKVLESVPANSRKIGTELQAQVNESRARALRQ